MQAQLKYSLWIGLGLLLIHCSTTKRAQLPDKDGTTTTSNQGTGAANDTSSGSTDGGGRSGQLGGAPAGGSHETSGAAGDATGSPKPSRASGGSPGTVPDQPQPFSGMRVGTNFWNIGWGIWDEVFDGAGTFGADSAPWNPQFLSELEPYGLFRFMDFAATNNSLQVRWEDRVLPSANPTHSGAVPWEWMIDLCNRKHKDMWLNVPHQADDDYVQQLATLVHASLESPLRVYIEWSNETWNGSFTQQQYSETKGTQLGLPNPAGDYHVYAAVRTFETFERVFGSDSGRLVKVIAGQSVNTWLTQQQLKALQDPVINPNRTKVDAYAIAPYFGFSVNGKDPDAVAQLQASITEVIGQVKAQYDLVHAAGLDLYGYEGGQHVVSGADVINAAPAMYDLYQSYLKGIQPYVVVFAHYLHNGQWADGGAWGAEEHVGQPLAEAHKLRSLYDFVASQK